MTLQPAAIAFSAALALAVPAHVAAGDTVKFINSEAASAAGFPFSEAVRVGDLVFLSGQIGYDRAAGKLVEGGIGPETRQTMDGIQALVERIGLGMDDLVKCTAMLADMSEWGAFNEVYRTYFPDGRFPARSALGVNGLALGARVEVECIAAAGKD